MPWILGKPVENISKEKTNSGKRPIARPTLPNCVSSFTQYSGISPIGKNVH